MVTIQIEQDVPGLGRAGERLIADPDRAAKPGQWAAWGKGEGRVAIGVQGEGEPRGMAVYLPSD